MLFAFVESVIGSLSSPTPLINRLRKDHARVKIILTGRLRTRRPMYDFCVDRGQGQDQYGDSDQHAVSVHL